MKKRIVLSSLIFITLLSACQTKQDNEARETKTELLARPEITQAATDGNGTTENSIESSSDIEMAGNYEKISVGDAEVYLPHMDESKQIRGVQYLYDAYFVVQNPSVYRTINRPEGTISVKEGLIGLSCYAGAYLDSMDISDDMRQTKIDYFKERLAEVYVPGNDNSFDIQAVSFALYEDFYDKIPGLTVEVYGVKSETWDMAELDKNGFAGCDRVAGKNITQSGVYYIDYSSYNKDGKYKQFIVKAEFDDMPMDYALVINDDMHYKIENRDSYQTWKENNNEWLIN